MIKRKTKFTVHFASTMKNAKQDGERMTQLYEKVVELYPEGPGQGIQGLLGLAMALLKICSTFTEKEVLDMCISYYKDAQLTRENGPEVV